MAPIISLSNELLLEVSSHIERKDCKNLRLTCNTFADVFATPILDSLTINLEEKGKKRKASGLDILHWMAGGHLVHRGRVEAIRKLTVQSLSSHNSTHNDESLSEADMLEKSAKSEQEINSLLEAALPSLPNVQTFQWHPNSHDPSSCHEVIARNVGNYPQLEHLHVDATYLTSPVLSHFKNLASISYLAWNALAVPASATVAESFARAVLQSPKLTSFKFDPAAGSEHDLDRIIQQCKEVGIVLPLRKLVLRGCLPPLTLLPHIQQITTLKVLPTPTLGKDAEERRQLFQDFWIGVMKNGTRLEHIYVDRVPDALVDYLKSYQGLKSFRLSNHDRKEDDVIEDVYLTAGRFYDEALTNHFSTLTSLDIDLEYEDQWCFRRTYGPTISKCQNLRTLNIGLGYGQIGGLNDVTDPQEAEYPCIHVLMDIAANHLGSLQELTMYNPLPDRSIASSPYSGHMEYYQHKGMWEISQHKLRKWCAPPSVGIDSLPKVYLPGYNEHFVYIPTEQADGGIKYAKQLNM